MRFSGVIEKEILQTIRNSRMDGQSGVQISARSSKSVGVGGEVRIAKGVIALERGDLETDFWVLGL
jgi:hypothetical protein